IASGRSRRTATTGGSGAAPRARRPPVPPRRRRSASPRDALTPSLPNSADFLDHTPSRRQFPAIGAGAALPPAPPPPAAAAPHGRRGAAHRLKLGVASYSLRRFSLDQALEMLREMDVRYVNFKDVHMPMTASPEALLAARKKVEAAGLTIMGGGTITLKNDAA